MPSSIILEEKPIHLAELKTKLEKRDSELGFRATKTKEYLKKFAKLDIKKSQELIKKIQDLNIPRIKNRQITKIVDLLPTNLDELRMIFVGEITTITPENMQQILDVVKEYA